MKTIRHYKKKTKKGFNIKKFIVTVLAVTVFAGCLYAYVDFCKYPEKYITTLRLQLRNDLKRGNAEAREYYNNNYISNGVYLYGEVK